MNILYFANRISKRLNCSLFLLFNRHRFGNIGANFRIYSPLKIQGHENIYLGDNVRISELTWLAALPLNGNSAKLVIGDGSQIGHFNHIYCTHSIIIENNVLIADKVYISDNAHSYSDLTVPILEQPIRQLNDVIIGEGSWIGENVCIIGVRIGKHCVIGANSVVTHDIPDYCVAVGSPARVIKKLKK